MIDIFTDSLRQARNTLVRLAVNCAAIPAVLQLFQHNRSIYALGVGKMSYVAGKFAASLRSIGADAHYLDSTHLVHGDIGVIRSGSIAFVFSKSGNSSELKAVVPAFREKSITVVLLTNNKRSPLAECCDHLLELCVEHEGDALNLMPLASTLSAMALADALVACLARQWDFTPEQFGKLHPAGQIGANLNRNLCDLIAWPKRRPFVRVGATVSDAMRAIAFGHCGIACVVDENDRLIGIVSDGDLRRALLDSTIDIHGILDCCINRAPIVIDANASLGDAYRLMEASERKLAAIPVLSNGACHGVILVHDLF